jgi:hypothetical protein
MPISAETFNKHIDVHEHTVKSNNITQSLILTLIRLRVLPNSVANKAIDEINDRQDHEAYIWNMIKDEYYNNMM